MTPINSNLVKCSKTLGSLVSRPILTFPKESASTCTIYKTQFIGSLILLIMDGAIL